MQNLDTTLHFLIKHTPAAVAMFDQEMCYLAHSDRWLIDYQLTDQNLIGRSHYEVFPDVLERWKQDHQRVLRGEVFVNEEDHWIRDDGTDVYLKYELRPWKDDKGEIGGLVMFTEVITEMVKTRKALEQRNKELQSIFDAFPDLFFRLDAEGRYLDFKAGMKATFMPPEMFLGKKIVDIMPPEAAEFQMGLLTACLKMQEVVSAEYSLPGDNGLEHFEVRFLPLTENEALAVVREISILVNSRNELRKTVEELKTSNIDLEQFAYVASHDLKEPIRMIGSFSQLIKRNYADKLDDKGKQYLDFIFEGSDRMKDITDSLLEFSRVGRKEQKLVRTDIRQLINERCIQLSVYILENNAQVKNQVNDCFLDCNSDQVALVFQNLIHNAIKFNNSEQPKVVISVEEVENEYVFSVQDNGIGINEEYTEKVFKIYQRLHDRRDFKGTGIGLALCKKIIERHQGKIGFKENPEETGTIFYFSIPKLG